MRIHYLSLVFFGAIAPDAVAQPAASIGEAIVGRDCGGCHATGARARSPLRKAPPLRTLGSRYEIDDLGEALAEGTFTGHPIMPVLRYEPDEIDAVLAYLKSIQTSRRRQGEKP